MVDTVIPATLRSIESPHAYGEVKKVNSNVGSKDNSPLTEFSGAVASDFALTQSEMAASGGSWIMPKLFTQRDFDNLVRDANLTRKSAEVVASRLKQRNLVTADFRITAARKRRNTELFDECFIQDEVTKIAYCRNVDELFNRLGHPHIEDEWRLFIDGSTASLKAVLLHIGNEHPSIPIAYATNLKESYESMKAILDLIQYNDHKWKICCDLKVVALLTGVKQGFSKHQCFLCNWEGRKRENHYTNQHWQPRVTFRVGVDSIDHMPLVPASKVILPPLHIKLGLVRNFTRALNHSGQAFAYLKTVFPKLSEAKIENGEF